MGKGTARKILLVAAGSVFLFSTCMVLKHHLEMRKSAEQIETVTQQVVVPLPEPIENKSAETVADQAAAPLPIQVDFDALCAQNQDVVAWIYCPDTPINYPVVQSADNEYYLHRLLDGSKNAAGTLFMDYRNAADLSDWNSIIYGHNMNNDSMFGTLTDYRMQTYFEAHPEMFLLTPERNYAVKVFAGFTTPADAELYTLVCPDETDKSRLIEEWIRNSDFVSGNTPAAEERFVTFSTCSYEYNDARYVLIGVLKELDP